MARALDITLHKLKCVWKLGHVNGQLAEKIHQVTFGSIRREELRPDLFPRGQQYRTQSSVEAE